MTLTLDDIKAAAGRIAGHVERTPCRFSRTLSEITGAEVWVKFENQQFTASYKERGALNRLSRLTDDERRRGVIAASAGNHAQGLAYHGERMGIPVTIVMPVGTPFIKVQQTRDFGANVVIEGEGYDAAYAKALTLCEVRGLVFVPAFDDYDVMAGQGTLALEMLEDAPDLEVLPVPIGGGGLISGVATAAKAINPDIQVIGVEPAMFPSFTARMRGLNAPAGGQTIAEGIAVKTIGKLTYGVARPLIDDVLLLEEPYFERAIALYCNVEKTVAEGAGAAALAALLAYPERFRGRKCGLILTGGNIDPRLLASVLTRELVRAQRLVSLRIIGDDRPGLLATVSTAIGALGGNILEVAHNRLALVRYHDRDPRRPAHPGNHGCPSRQGLPTPERMMKRLMKTGAATLLVVCAVLSLGACAKKSSDDTTDVGKAFLAQNARAPGIHVTASGLQYRILQSGPANGLRPKPADEVKVNYEGKLLDGVVFDSSYQRGEPVVMTVRDLVPGWVEALQLMRPGDQWLLYVPPSLGYGDKGAGPIPPNSVLVFKLELIAVAPDSGSIAKG